jgi:hypothetical protein
VIPAADFNHFRLSQFRAAIALAVCLPSLRGHIGGIACWWREE